MYFIIFLIPLMFGFASDTGDSWQTTFCNIVLIGSFDFLQCDRLQDTLTFEAGTNINIELFNTTDKIKISATGGNSPNELYCTVGKWFNSFNATTSNFNCETVPTGATYQNNTQSSPTHANSLVLPKVGVDLPIKGIACGGSIVCSSNGTDVTLTFTATGGTAKEDLVGLWHIDRTWANIGTSFVNTYTTGNSDPVRIDTSGKTTVTLMIDWTKVGGGTQSCQIVSTTNGAIVLVRIADLISGININDTQDISANAENRFDTFKPQCKSTISTNDPVWLSGQVLLK